MNRHLIAAAVLAFGTVGAFAQTHAASSVQRDVNQDKRIEQGLQNGSLTTREAAELQRDQSKVDRLQAKALNNGTLSDAERAKLQKAQNKTSRDIRTAEHNGVNGNPLSASSQRMQADVQRNEQQQQRVEQGVKSGSMTNHEVAKVERNESKIDHQEYAAGRDGRVGKHEQHRIQHADNKESGKIHHEKHDAQQRKNG
jgi:hypothetical protein